MKVSTGKLIVALTGLVWLTGCASIGPPLPPALELPRPPSDLRALRKGDKVTLTWTIPERTTERQSVRYLGETRVCRSLDAILKQCDALVAEVPPPAGFASNREASGQKLAGSYTDRLPREMQRRDVFGSATYAVEVLNRDGRAAGLSNQVHVALAETLAPPTNFKAQMTAQGVDLTWTGEILPPAIPEGVRYGYRVYRRAEGSQQKILVGERMAGADKNQSIVDESLEWEKTYNYHAETFTVISQVGTADVSVEGDDTPELQVFAHDVFPPAVPTGLQAVFSGPGQERFIDLIWTPVTDMDLDGYNIYRHEEGAAPVKLNSEPVKTPAYRDTRVVAGKTYFYSVSAADARGNESGHSEESGERVP
jgi:hypothetical protein